MPSLLPLLLTLGAHASEFAPVVTEIGAARIDWTAMMLHLDAETAPAPGSHDELEVVEQEARAQIGPQVLDAARQVRVDAATRTGDLLGSETPLGTRLAETTSSWYVSESRYHTSGKVGLTAVLDLGAWLAPVLRARARDAELPATDASNFTGVVVDARGLVTEGALAPRLLSPEGAELYGVDMVLQKAIQGQPPVQYVSDPADPRAWQRAGEAPLLLRAASVRDEVDLVLTAEDSVRLQTVASRDVALLAQARVVLVLDP
jgi:hypothetical protein